MKAAVYLRVSTSDQEIQNQSPDLLNYIRARGWELAGEFSDIGISGAKSRRPGLDALMAAARKRKFDAVLCWRFDRFARSTKHLTDALHEFRGLGIRFISYQENIDLGTPMGEAMFTIISAIAQLERDIIRERIKAGLKRVRAEGKTLGRPAKEIDLPKVLELRAQGKKIREIAEVLGLSKSRVAIAVKNVTNPLKGGSCPPDPAGQDRGVAV